LKYPVLSLALLMVITICNSCGKGDDNGKAVLPSDDPSLEHRLAKSEEIRVRISGVRKALRSVDTLLGDIAKALVSHPTIEGKPAEKTQTYLDLIQKFLKQSTEGLVQIESDQSWVLDRAVPTLGQLLNCSKMRTRIVGRVVEGIEQLHVYLLDCASPQKSHTLLEAKLIKGDEVELEVNPNVFSSFTEQPVKSDKCEVKLSKDRTEVHCRPIEIKSDGWTAIISPVDVIETPTGLWAKISTRVWNPQGKESAVAELDQEPGRQPKINIVIR
jgi:hypothetical protein